MMSEYLNRSRVRDLVGLTILVLLVCSLVFTQGVKAEHDPVILEKTVSEGIVKMGSEANRYIMIVKENGLVVALDLTQETQIFFEGEEQKISGFFSQLKLGKSRVSAEHYTNDAGMQEALKVYLLELE